MRQTIGWIVLALTLHLASSAQGAQTSTNSNQTKEKEVAASDSMEAELGGKLLKVRRIYVDSFGDDTISKQLQAMVITSLSESKRFIVTENKDRADACLRGTGLEKTSQEIHSYDDSTAASHVSGAANRDVAVVGGAGAAIKDSATNTETIDNARLAVRLVDRDGDVIWSTTQESKGAKYKGASADVAEKIVKQLLRDLDKQERKNSPTGNGK